MYEHPLEMVSGGLTKEDDMKAFVDRAFLNHCSALARLARVRGPAVSRIAAGAELWGKLRRWEARGARLALRMCNGPGFRDGEIERETERIVAGVLSVLGRGRLPGMRVNLDPRGYALKISGDARGGRTGFGSAVFDGLLRDWGGDYLLAPDFGGRS